MLLSSLKKYGSFVFIFLFLINSAHAEAKKTVLTLGGSSGLITVASTDVVKGLNIGVWATSDFGDGTNFAIRGALGFGDSFEVFGGADIPTAKSGTTDGLFGAKWSFLNSGEVTLGLLGNIQFNSFAKSTRVDGQILLVSSWVIGGTFKTSANFGKSLGKSTSWGSWDFGMGAEWWLVDKPVFSLAWVFDFANYSYRVSGMENVAGFNQGRGIFSTTARFSFLSSLIMLDIGGSDLLDSSRSFIANLTVNLGF